MACSRLSLRGAPAIAAPGLIDGLLRADGPTATDPSVAGRFRSDPRGPTGTTRGAVASAALCLALSTGGCSWSGEHPVALAAPDPPPAVPVVRTVRRTAAVNDSGLGPLGGTPTPRQIFDFHPPGSAANGWRQPFLIDPNDGPLAGEVRKTAAELKAYLVEEKAKPKGSLQLAAPRRCGETDVAARQPGCAGSAAGSLAAAPSGAPDHP